GVKVIHAGTVWTGTSGAEQHNVDIVVSGNRIQSVGPAKPRSAYGRRVRYVDASADTVIPGLWDAHSHENMDQPFAGNRRDRLETYVRLPNSYEQTAIAAGHEMGIPSFSHYFWPALAFGQDGTSHWATQRLGYQLPVSNDTVAYNDTIQLYARSGMAITNTP